MIELTRQVEFSASHRLHNSALDTERNLELFGICNNPHGHGHNYVLDVTLRGDVDPETGMLLDLNRLCALLEEQIVRQLDHKHLNHDVEWLAGRVTTAENVAAAMWERLAPLLDGMLYRLRLYESRQNFVDYYGPAGAPVGR